MPWIERHGDGYRVGWRAGGRKSPKEYSDALPSKAEAVAESKAIAARLAALAGRRPRAAEPWAAMVTRFLASREKTATEAHRAQMDGCLAALAAEHGWKGTADVRPTQCLGLKPYHGRVLRAFLRYAILADQQVDPRCIMVRPLRERKAERKRESALLSDQEVADLIAAAGKWSDGSGALAHMIAMYGLRSESLIRLPCSALASAEDGSCGELRLVVKSGDSLVVPLRSDSLELLRKLAQWRRPDDPLFPSHHNGTAWKSGQAFAAWWGHSVAMDQRGRGILDLRRWATTRQMAAAGQNAKAVADAQGRRTVALVAQVYQRSTTAEREGVFMGQPALPKPSSVPPGAPKRSRKSLTGH